MAHKHIENKKTYFQDSLNSVRITGFWYFSETLWPPFPLPAQQERNSIPDWQLFNYRYNRDGLGMHVDINMNINMERYGEKQKNMHGKDTLNFRVVITLGKEYKWCARNAI